MCAGMLTGHAPAPEQRAGLDDVIAKPMAPVQLFEVLPRRLG
jgi:hypothetical protein